VANRGQDILCFRSKSIVRVSTPQGYLFGSPSPGCWNPLITSNIGSLTCMLQSLLSSGQPCCLPRTLWAWRLCRTHPGTISSRLKPWIKTLEGVTTATGESTQVVHGDRVTSRLILRFRDGSIDDDATVFSERRIFRIISDHHIQHGPSLSGG